MNTQTPAGRALLQFVESLFISALIAGLASVGPLLTQTGPINWRAAGLVFGIAALFSVAHGVVAYLKPSEPDLASALTLIVDALETRVLHNNTPPATPLQGLPPVQGPLVVVNHGMPQNGPEKPNGAPVISVQANAPVESVQPSVEAVANPADTVKLPAIKGLA